MAHPGELSKTAFIVCMGGIALWVLILPATHVYGLPYGPHPPETESGFSFKNFKDFVLAGITPETHTHDPAEIYMHKGQEPAVAEVGVATPAEGQKLLVENELGVNNEGGADSPLSNEGQPAKIVLVAGEDGDAIQEKQQHKQEEEAVETLDVPHEHPKMEFSDVIGDENLVAGEQEMKELPDAKVMAAREEI